MRILSALLILSVSLIGCSTAGKNTAYGGGIGAGVGALAGAIIGHQSGNKGKGAAIGAAIGGLGGVGVGAYLDKQAAELEQIAETKRTENGIITKLKGDILFASGSHEVNGAAKSNVAKISAILAKYPEDIITVVGHTDSTGSDSKNQTLSQQRAAAIQALMINGGVRANISSVGMGETSPIAANNSNSGRSANRRVEIQIRVNEEALKN